MLRSLTAVGSAELADPSLRAIKQFPHTLRSCFGYKLARRAVTAMLNIGKPPAVGFQPTGDLASCQCSLRRLATNAPSSRCWPPVVCWGCDGGRLGLCPSAVGLAEHPANRQRP